MRFHLRSWQAILLLGLVIYLLISASAVVADNTLVVNPYAGVDWDSITHYRANLHTHTTESDGRMDPSEVIDEYHQRGYDILALTDHNRNTWPWDDFGRDPAQLGMLAVSGNELSRHHHTGALFCQLETEERDHDVALREVGDAAGLAILYHPGRYWQPPEDAPETVPEDALRRYVGLFNRHDHLVGMEIINAGNRYPQDRLLWDALLAEMMPERPVHAFADDDMHSIGALGRDWTVYPLPELTEKTLREAVTTGTFYAASVSTHPEDERSVAGTPVITRISHDEEAGSLSAEATLDGQQLADDAYHWIADGEVVHVGPTLQYRDENRIGNYVRLEVTGTGGTAFTNAFGFKADETGETQDQGVLGPAPEGTFTVVVLPDTQDYVGPESRVTEFFEEDVLKTSTQWIADNHDDQRIVFVSHVGDVVNHASSREEWEHAREAMDILHGVIPYGISVGNHDMDTRTGDKPLFEEFFGAERFTDFEWYGGAFDNNHNSYQLISAGGLDFIFLHLECNAPDNVLQWASGVLEEHSDRRAIVTTHMWLGPMTHWGDGSYHNMTKGRMQWIKCHRNNNRGNSPKQIWDKLVRWHPNIMMVLCGDQRGTQALRMQTVGEEDNMVHELLSDIRDGYIRLMRFDPASNRIDVMTYSPVLQRLCDGTSETMSGPRQPIGVVTDITQHQFILSHDLR